MPETITARELRRNVYVRIPADHPTRAGSLVRCNNLVADPDGERVTLHGLCVEAPEGTRERLSAALGEPATPLGGVHLDLPADTILEVVPRETSSGLRGPNDCHCGGDIRDGDHRRCATFDGF